MQASGHRVSKIVPIGVPFSPTLPRGIQRIDARTNRTLRPADLTNAVWVYRASIRVRGRLWQRTYPCDVRPTERQAIRFILEERGIARRELLTLPAAKRPSSGFSTDIAAYLQLKRGMPSFADREREIRMWQPLFGNRSRDQVTAIDIERQVVKWRNETRTDGTPRYAATTINHWRTALSDLYTRLNGRSGYNPVRDVPKLVEPDAIDRALPMPVIRLILQRMEENGRAFAERTQRNERVREQGRHVSAAFGMLSAIRAKILAFTGMRAGELMSLTATDLNFSEEDPTVSVRTTKGGKNRRIPLTREAASALKALRALDGFGHFSESSFGKAVRAACRRVKSEYGEPIPSIRPHDFRHSFATWLVNEGGVSMKTAQEMLGHRNIRTTARYVRASEADARKALRKLDQNQTPD